MLREVAELRPQSLGTPKTLEEAIRRSINLATGNAPDERCAIARDVELAVRDYLSQKFTPAYYERINIQELWMSIVGEPKRLPWFTRDILARKAANAAKAPGSCL